MIEILRRMHNSFRARLLKHYRTKEVVRVFQISHAQELKDLPYHQWPAVQARQTQEIAAVKAGRLDIVDRKSWAWPFIPATINRLATPLMKATPYALRRMSRTPVPRRAINLIKNALIGQAWDVQPIDGVAVLDSDKERDARIRIAKKIFTHPNNEDSFQTWMEQGLEDLLIFGSFSTELSLTPDPERPIKMWAVNTESIRIFPNWAESLSQDYPHYAQMTGLKGERGAVLFYDDELMYVRDNIATDTPFGTGKMEVGFRSITDFLGVQDMSGRAGTDQVHKTWLWWEQPQCFDDQTEVLTTRGWVPWSGTLDTDCFATRSADGKFEWQQCTALHKKHYKGNLVQFQNRNLRIQVTPNHRMFGRYKYSGRQDGKHIYYFGDEQFAQACDVISTVANKPGKGSKISVGSDIARMTTRKPKCHIDRPDPNCKRCRNRLVMRRYYDRIYQGIAPGQSSKKTPADFVIPARSKWVDGVLPAEKFTVGKWEFDWQDWAAFLGIWMAEGSTSGNMHAARLKKKQGVKEPGYIAAIAASADGNAFAHQKKHCTDIHTFKVIVAQSSKANSEKYQAIKSLMDKMNLPYYTHGNAFTFTCRDIWEHLAQFGNKYTKWVPDYIKDAPSDVISTFVHWACIGDGWLRGNKGARGYFTTSRKLADDLQELFQKIGSSASIGRSNAHVDKHGRCISPGYSVIEQTTEEISLMPSAYRPGRGMCKPQLVPYDGMVYCATVPNSTLYCRRNGYAFWSGNSEAAYQIVRRHIQNELEGQAKISIVGGMKKPEVIEVQPTVESDLLLGWQEVLIRMIGNAFDLSAMALGVEHDVNRAVGEVLDDRDHRSAVVPMGKRLAEALTTRVLHNKLHWYDIEFVYLNLDDPDMVTKLDMLTRMYSANAETPNGIRIGMGKQPLDSPFADLTQFECMLLNVQAQVYAQEEAAKTQQEMQPPAPPAGPGGPSGPGQGPGTTPAVNGPPQKSIPPGQAPGKKGLPPGQQPPTTAPGGPGGQKPLKIKPKVASPTKLSLPKFPISGTAYTAMELAEMPVDQLRNLFDQEQMPPVKNVMHDMENQEPGILEQLSEETKEFFEERKQKEQAQHRVKPIDPKIIKQWAKEQQDRLKEHSKRTASYSEFVEKRGQQAMKPGGPGSKGIIPKAGKPGQINPIVKQ